MERRIMCTHNKKIRIRLNINPFFLLLNLNTYLNPGPGLVLIVVQVPLLSVVQTVLPEMNLLLVPL